MIDESNHSYEVHFNSLYILESLKDEQKTGKWLYEDLKFLTYTDNIYKISYVSFENREQFLNELVKIKYEITNNLYPIIHIEAHGNQIGFEIAHSKEFISWEILNDLLAEINYLCRNNLVLSLGICNGHFINVDLIQRFQNNKRCPYIINISSQDKISSHEIKLGYSSFYNSLFIERDFQIAMLAMKNETVLNFLSTADITAKAIIKELNDMSKSADFTYNSSNQLQYLNRLGKNPFNEINYNRTLKKFKRFKKQYYKSHIEPKWNHFLMIDVFEENKTRFENFEKVWNSYQ